MGQIVNKQNPSQTLPNCDSQLLTIEANDIGAQIAIQDVDHKALKHFQNVKDLATPLFSQEPVQSNWPYCISTKRNTHPTLTEP